MYNMGCLDDVPRYSYDTQHNTVEKNQKKEEEGAAENTFSSKVVGWYYCSTIYRTFWFLL